MDNHNIFEQEFPVFSYYVDYNRKLAPHYLLLMMQEVAWAHVEYHHIGWEFLAKANRFWALIRLHVQIDRMPRWNEVVRLRTWGKPADLLLHYRDHEMVDEQGNVIIRSTSAWVILDFKTGRPQKAEDLPTHLYVNNTRHAIEKRAPKIKTITLSETNPEYKPVLFSDLDVNQHVNNSKYLQFAIDAFDMNFLKTHELKDFNINFTRQAKAGDMYAVQFQEESPFSFISSIYAKEGGELARVQTSWKPI
ncbi:MAG: hypothetical protein LBR51_03965 [Bacteroidales bacterium]|jgi:acyl-ACP thioesterase|nr:hypothetical protein [Bacteroidales bacterium]